MKKNNAQAAQHKSLKVAVYCRVSSEEQREKETIKTQIEETLRYCEYHKLEVFEVYKDDGVSGTIPFDKRPTGARLVAAAEAGKFSRVIVYRLDRMGRRVRVILDVAEQLDNCGVTFQSVTEPFETHSPTGRLLMGLLAVFAEFERDSIAERSVAGTNRCAREGVWLGGIAPYGYRKVGNKQAARIQPSVDPIIGYEQWSEIDAVKFMYNSLANDGHSCEWVAGELNRRGIPPAYTRDGRETLHNKRTVATAGVWRAARVRNLIVNSVYKGVHQYGRRSTKEREIISREVPSIVDGNTWERAQETLQKNRLFSPRNTHRQYLLRGLIKCGLCGLNYIGTGYPLKQRVNGKDIPTGKEKFYYQCSGKHGGGKAGGRGMYGLQGKACPSKSVPGIIEEKVWEDIEAFLRDPAPILAALAAESEDTEAAKEAGQEANRLERDLLDFDAQRNRVMDIYRRGRIKTAMLDAQLEAIDKEEAELQARVASLRERANRADKAGARLQTAETLLKELNARLDGPLTWETKREIVEHLVDRMTIETVGDDDVPQLQKEAIPRIRYKFTPVSFDTDTDSLQLRA